MILLIFIIYNFKILKEKVYILIISTQIFFLSTTTMLKRFTTYITRIIVFDHNDLLKMYQEYRLYLIYVLWIRLNKY